MNYMLENECFYSEVQLAFLASLIAAFPELLLLLPLANTRRCFCAAALHVSVCQTLVLHALFTSDRRHSARYRQCKCALHFHLHDTALLTVASDQTAVLEACLSLLSKAEWTSVVWLPRLQKNLKANFLTADKKNN